VPAGAPSSLLNPLSIAAFNELWYHRARRHGAGALQPMSGFFHPLDGIGDWNLLYGRRGFVQYQFAVSAARSDVVRQVVGLLAMQHIPSFLGVLKRFGPADPGPLTFPMEGWTLAVDLPIGPPALPALLDRLDELVAEAGGRVYLAKDARLRPSTFAAMYPRTAELAKARAVVDPHGVLQSDLARRLRLV